jgi:hypothetical protein
VTIAPQAISLIFEECALADSGMAKNHETLLATKAYQLI